MTKSLFSRLKLVGHWRLWWRRWSTWLAGLNAALWANLTAKSGLLLGFIPFVPASWRGMAVGATFAVTFIVPVLVVHIRQTKLAELAHEPG
jgi:hypothetical protein